MGKMKDLHAEAHTVLGERCEHCDQPIRLKQPPGIWLHTDTGFAICDATGWGVAYERLSGDLPAPLATPKGGE